MSMLAERRRKTKWTLNPGRQALWKKADSDGIKFGQGLMEKMGWKVGQGLGVNEQGIKEPLKIAVKSDSKGMGFKDNDDEWIQQQQDFNALLGKLSSSNDTDGNNICSNSNANQSRTSLVEKSKHSKARVHYQKFTKGKDLTNYSEKDLECIFGGKKESKESSNHVINSGYSNVPCSELEENSLAVHAGSMVDYFTQKMLRKKNAGAIKSGDFDNSQESVIEGDKDLEEAAERQTRKKKSKKQRKEDDTDSRMALVDDQESQGQHCMEVDDNERTISEERHEIKSQEYSVGVTVSSQDADSDGKSAEINESVENPCSVNPEDDAQCKHIKRKKKKGKEKEHEENSVVQLETEVINQEKEEVNDDNVECPEVTKKRKKSHRKEIENSVPVDACTEDENQRRKKKRKKHSKEEENTVEEDETKSDRTSDGNVMNSVSECSEKIRTKTKEGVKDVARESVDVKGKWENDNYQKENGKKENGAASASYKTELLEKRNALKDDNANKILDLICCTNVDKFRGSNLAQIKGYGIVRYIKDNSDI